MLEAVGHPVAVNPDRSLAKVAREREWEMRQFTKPVRLRDRMSVRTPVVTTSLALAVAVALSVVAGPHGDAPVGRTADGPRRSPGAVTGLRGPPGGPGVRSRAAAWRRRRRG